MAIVIAVLCVGGYVFAPSGDNQTYLYVLRFARTTDHESSVWRYSIILTLVSCYLLYMIQLSFEVCTNEL